MALMARLWRAPKVAPGAALSVHDRTAEFLMPVRKRRRDIVTPEGVRLQVELADIGERAAAFLIDFSIILGTNIAIVVLALLVAGVGLRARLAIALVGLVGFLLRSLYFVHFELAWRGVTPGKRAVGLRVIDRRGAPLLPSAIITRNITREVETFLPLMALLAARVTGGWGAFLAVLWLGLLAAVPFYNRDRMRVGDLLAGTIVITAPKHRLSADLIEAAQEFSFTDKQLRAYGAFELQILEEVLRRVENAETQTLMVDVSARICARIGWTEAVPPAACRRFLVAFYAAQRAHLEREQIYGRGRDVKVEF